MPVKGLIFLCALPFVSLAAIADEQLEAGRKVFSEQAQPSCTICHTLADANAAGEIGPSLDELGPSVEQVKKAVTGGVGIMPAYEGSLTPEQISAVAHYVATITSK
ncbi:c-type cytochrome [Marinobacter changyiensis]|uniref:SorU family sulfite dehydrogenase c-type cytochrome subunit n=1 Tax=Marinobacter changyiensis TaxID=2604091 RepID=UPI00126435AE|nr:cytochrome c [Marinobacter changyiensis]